MRNRLRRWTFLCALCVLVGLVGAGALAAPMDEYALITVQFKNDRGQNANGDVYITQIMPGGTKQYATGYGMSFGAGGGTTVTSWSGNAGDLYGNSAGSSKLYSLPAGTYVFATAGNMSGAWDMYEAPAPQTITVDEYGTYRLSFTLKINCVDMAAHTRELGTDAALSGAAYIFGQYNRNGGEEMYLTGYDQYNRPVYSLDRSAAKVFAANDQGDVTVPRIEHRNGIDVYNTDFFFEQVTAPTGYEQITGTHYMESDNAVAYTFYHTRPTTPVVSVPKTGDSSKLALWATLCLLSLVGITCLTIKRRGTRADHHSTPKA